MTEAAPDPWEAAARIAERHNDVAVWQRELASAIAHAASPDVAGVFLCTLGNMAGHTPAVAPLEHATEGQRLVELLLPRARAAGLDDSIWAMRASPGEICGRVVPLRDGFSGMMGSFLRSEEGMVAGWIVLLCRAPVRERLGELRVPFAKVCRAAQAAVRSSLAMAAAMGARFPRVSPAALSERELEVAILAASGFSDLNIGARLEISEGTVGRHLHNIYRKLGIVSRMQLSELLCAAM